MAARTPSLPLRFADPELIAHGGMADVVRASDETLGRTVAIKVLAERYAREEEFHTRFLREAKTAARLSGEPYVVTIHDIGESGEGRPFIVMEHAAGGTVADRLRDGPVDPLLALRWLEEAAAALDAAHARGVVHRDVKPANLLLTDDGTIRVSDFGIARVAGYDTLTAVGTVLGSSGYMAPEQARGEKSTPATDRYALACVAFELLTGGRPFERESMAAEAAAHAHEPPPEVGTIHPGLPSALDRVFARGLAKQPADRPESCRGLVGELREALIGTEETTLVAPTSATAPRITLHGTRPRRGVVLGAAAVVLALGALSAWALASVGGGSTLVLTQTVQGRTVERTVTESDTVVRTETVDAAPDATQPSPGTGESGAALNDQGFALLQRGDVQGALPLLESAVAALHGSSTLAEAYASYNLAVARFGVGRCDGVGELLDRSQEVQGERKEIDRLRRKVEHRCEEKD